MYEQYSPARGWTSRAHLKVSFDAFEEALDLYRTPNALHSSTGLDWQPPDILEAASSLGSSRMMQLGRQHIVSNALHLDHSQELPLHASSKVKADAPIPLYGPTLFTGTSVFRQTQKTCWICFMVYILPILSSRLISLTYLNTGPTSSVGAQTF